MAEEYVAQVPRSLDDLVPNYLERRRDDVVAIRSALAEGDLETAGGIGHAMKGSGSGYGFDGITEFGAHIEHACKDGDADAANRAVDGLEHYLEVVRIEYLEDE